jgi:hypothetical protein
MPKNIRKNLEFLPHDIEVIEENRKILKAESFIETVRRSSLGMNEILKDQEAGGEIIVRKKGGKETILRFVY